MFERGLPEVAQKLTRINQFKKNEHPWKLPEDHHVTMLYLGRNPESKIETGVFKTFNENEQVNVTVKAIVYVQDEIIVGVTFQPIEVENEKPHVTLMIS